MLYYTTDGQLLAMFALGTLGYNVTVLALSQDFVFAKIFQKNTGNFKTRRKIFCTLTLNIPSLARQRCLPSWGPRRTPWFFFVISQLFDAVDYSNYVFWVSETIIQ